MLSIRNKSKSLLSSISRNYHYPIYNKLNNHLNVSEFRRKFEELNVEDFKKNELEQHVTLTGRVMSIRSSGTKLHFIDLLQDGQKVQLILNQPVPSPFTKGDIVEASGFPGRSKSGELSCKLNSLRVLAPCLINLPDDKIGIKNPELRSRRRHLDLIANPDSFETFRLRSKIISKIRTFLDQHGFMEVETPILSEQSGGAIAKPFRTKMTAGQKDLTLRIAPELYLKRLIIGGFDKVFELGKQFRDEGVDSTHNPEFTSCEFYSAYTDLNGIIRLVEELFTVLSEESYKVFIPFKRVDILTELSNLTGTQIDPLNPEVSLSNPDLLKFIPSEYHNSTPAKIFDKLISSLIEPQCITPTLLLGHPTFMSPLAKENPNRPGVSERFELFIEGREIANGYVELNDPKEQSRRFRSQSSSSDEIPPADEEFVEALKAGMPPTTGCGIGIDRLVMLLTNQKQIRNVLFFPL